MSRGIIIFGSSASGKTTLGRMVAKRLQYPYYDIDDYIWRRDVEVPFSVRYSHDERISRLMNDISKSEHFVMAGSMDSFHEPFDPLFDLAVHIHADWNVRKDRLQKREYALYGERILKGGDMYEEQQQFLDESARYETDGSPCLRMHLAWAQTLPCKVLYLNGNDDLESNAIKITEAYLNIKKDEKY